MGEVEDEYRDIGKIMGHISHICREYTDGGYNLSFGRRRLYLIKDGEPRDTMRNSRGPFSVGQGGIGNPQSTRERE